MRLRPWRKEDRAPFAAINAEPAVQRHLAPITREISDAMLERFDAHFASHGWGFWAVEHRDSAALIGLCGLAQVSWQAFFTPAVEIGWRLSTQFHGKGLAREAATLALDAAFGPIGLDRVVSFAVPANAASWRLMERLEMRHLGQFDHPRLPKGDLLRRHVVYAISRMEWSAQARAGRAGRTGPDGI